MHFLVNIQTCYINGKKTEYMRKSLTNAEPSIQVYCIIQLSNQHPMLCDNMTCCALHNHYQDTREGTYFGRVLLTPSVEIQTHGDSVTWSLDAVEASFFLSFITHMYVCLVINCCPLQGILESLNKPVQFPPSLSEEIHQ